MRVCMILEGCYPYIRGGVSTWAHEYMKSKSETEFILWTVHAKHEMTKKSLYDLPDNVVEMHEIFLEDAFENAGISGKKSVGREAEVVDALGQLLLQDGNNWERFLTICHNTKCTVADIAGAEAFLNYAIDLADNDSEPIGLSDAFYGLRSMLLPVLYILNQPIPKADIYHSAVAGYGGLLGAMASLNTGRPFILTEHGIYPREREEELMQAEWVAESMRDTWIQMFYNMSRCAYYYAARVTSLFSKAKERQCEIGCSAQKCRIVPNGICFERFGSVPERKTDDNINIGAFIRFAPIKDVKTLIRAFYSLSKQNPSAVLYIMGGTDDPAYEAECRDLIQRLDIKNIRVEGHVNTVEYMEIMDFTVMTSISEGQPLAILESLAAGRPCVTTKVGNCVGLLEQPEDDFGRAGICCVPMDADGLAEAMNRLCKNLEYAKELGKNGRNRVRNGYTHEIMMDRYYQLYSEVC